MHQPATETKLNFTRLTVDASVSAKADSDKIDTMVVRDTVRLQFLVDYSIQCDARRQQAQTGPNIQNVTSKSIMFPQHRTSDIKHNCSSAHRNLQKPNSPGGRIPLCVQKIVNNSIQLPDPLTQQVMLLN